MVKVTSLHNLLIYDSFLPMYFLDVGKSEKPNSLILCLIDILAMLHLKQQYAFALNTYRRKS